MPIKIELGGEKQTKTRAFPSYTPSLFCAPGSTSLFHSSLFKPSPRPSSAGGWGMGAVVCHNSLLLPLLPPNFPLLHCSLSQRLRAFGINLLQHSLLHRLQGNPLFSAWSTFSSSFSHLAAHRIFFSHTLFLTPHCLCSAF